MSLFGSLYIGDSGLRTSQNALHTVAHNLSNISTPGYVRQQVANTDTQYSSVGTNAMGRKMLSGYGAKYAECRHVRDAFLDATYRHENGRLEYYNKSYDVMAHIEDILGELDAAAFKGSLEGLWTAMQQISTSPNDVTNISLLVSKAAQFAENATAVYGSFVEYQNNLNRQVINSVKEINKIGQQIHELNRQIIKIESGDIENANDLRDKRDLLLDQLSGYGNITFQEHSTGAVTVQFNHNDFVTMSQSYDMELLVDEDTGYVTPYWKQNVVYKENIYGVKEPDYDSARVFDVTEDISSKRDTDVGSLRALLLARGDHAATYVDLETGMCNQRKLDSLDIKPSQYDEEQGLKYYDKYIKNSCMMNIEAEFDNIVHQVVTLINQTLAEAAAKNPASGYLLNADGTPMQMFLKNETPAYEKVSLTDEEIQDLKAQGVHLVQIYDENGHPLTNTFWKYIEEDPEAPFSLYSCENIRINEKLVQVPSLLGFKTEDDSVDYRIIGEMLVNTFQNTPIYLNPNATAPSTIESCYTDLMSQVANSGFIFYELADFERLEVESADNERQTVIGVSSDDELEHMIMYQNAYNAASRYINVINSMLDTLLSMAS